MYAKLAARSQPSSGPRNASASSGLAARAPVPARAKSRKGSHWRPQVSPGAPQGLQEILGKSRGPPKGPTGRTNAPKRKGGARKATPARNAPAIGGPRQTVAQWLEGMRQAALRLATWKIGLLFLDLFSGANSPMGREVKARGGAVIAFDWLIDARFDLSRADVQEALWGWIRQGLVWGVWLGTECTTWSVASYSKGPGWFNSYRSRGNLWGELAALSPRAREKVLQGNADARFTIQTLQKISNQPLAVGGMENPSDSVIWKLPEFQALLDIPNVFATKCDYCQYGARWKKPSRFLFVGGRKALAPSKLCKQAGKLCSRTKKPHLKLGQGRCHPSSGLVLTKLATEYPRKLATQILDCMAG